MNRGGIGKAEKSIKRFLTTIYPDWAQSTTESQNYRTFVLDKHAILERLIDELIMQYFFGKSLSGKSIIFNEKLLSKFDFSKKASLLPALGLVDERVKKTIFKINEFRVAQAHLKKDDPLRSPSVQNWAAFNDLCVEVFSIIIKNIEALTSEKF